MPFLLNIQLDESTGHTCLTFNCPGTAPLNIRQKIARCIEKCSHEELAVISDKCWLLLLKVNSDRKKSRCCVPFIFPVKHIVLQERQDFSLT